MNFKVRPGFADLAALGDEPMDQLVREAIHRLRAAHRPTNSAVPTSQRASDASLLSRLEAAHARNRELATEVRQLREQLARAHVQLRAARLTSAARN